MLLVNLLGAHAARATTLAQQASRRRKALDTAAVKRSLLVAAAAEAALARKTAVSPELVDEAEARKAISSMIGPGPSPSEQRYRARTESGAMLAPVKLLKDTGRGAPEKTFTGALKLGQPYSPAPHDTRSTKSDRLFVGAGRVVGGQTRQVTYAAKQVFAVKAGTGSVAYQSQVRMMSRWGGVLNTPAPEPRLAQPQPERAKRQPLPDSVTAWRPLTIDGRKRRR